jgi:putative membrane protein
MMYYGGAGWLGWIWMGFAMIAFWAVVITLVVWAMKSFSKDADIKPPSSGALSILQERFARGEISNEEYARQSQLIRSTG